VRVIGRTKPKGVMKVKGGRPGVLVASVGALRGRSLTGRCRRLVFPYQSEVIPKGVRGVSPYPPSSASGLVGARRARRSELPCWGSLVRRGAQARDLPFDAVARICCWPHRLCLGSRLVRRVSLGGLWVGGLGSSPGSSGAVSPSDPALFGVA